MLLKALTLLAVFHLIFCINQDENIANTISVISEFIVAQNCSTKVIALVCWSKVLQVKLWRELSKNGISSTINAVSYNTLYYPQPENHHMFLIDASCKESKDIFKSAQRLRLFNQPFRWLICETIDYAIFDDFYFSVGSRVFIIEEDRAQYRIKSLYKHTRNSSVFLENYIAEWTKEEGLIRSSEFSDSRNRTDLKGITVGITHVVTHNDTINHLEDYKERHVDSTTKINWFPARYLMEIMNATPKHVFVWSWGYKNATTNLYDGLIGELQSGRSELGATPAFLTADRFNVVDYLGLSCQACYLRFYFRAPPLSFVANIFTLPFSRYVWYCSFALTALILIVTYIIVKWEWKDRIFKEKLTQPTCLRPDIAEVLIMGVGTVTQQGTELEPRSISGRIVTIFALVSLMFLYTAYAANIVALLQSSADSIRTLEDLLNSGMPMGADDVVFQRYYFQNAKEPIKKAIYEKRIAPKGQKPNFMSPEEGLRLMHTEVFAFHVESNIAYKMISDTFLPHEKCKLKGINYFTNMLPQSTIKKNSSYKEIFLVGSKKIIEAGLQERERNLIYEKKPKCQGSLSNFESAGLTDCYAAFLIFGIGVGCSLILFIMEVFFTYYQQIN